MTLLDRYIARMFLTSYAVLLTVGMGMLILGGMLLNLDEITRDNPLSAMELIRRSLLFHGWNLPLYYSQMGGVLIAVAAAFTCGALLRQREFTALAAAGVPLQRVLTPLLGIGLGLTALWTANQELLLPRVAPRISYRYADIVQSEAFPIRAVRDSSNAILQAERMLPERERLEQVLITEPDEFGRPRGLIQADAATYDAAAGVWRLERGRRWELPETAPDGSSSVRQEAIDAYPFGLDPRQLSLRRNSHWRDMLSLRELQGLLRSPHLPNRATLVKSVHVRTTQPLFHLALLLLVAPFFLSREPENVLACGGRALLVGGAFFGAVFMLHSLPSPESLAALLAWLPLLVFIPLAVLNAATVKT